MMSFCGTDAKLLDIEAKGSAGVRLVKDCRCLLDIDDKLGNVARGHVREDLEETS
jgi:hypothetical protein